MYKYIYARIDFKDNVEYFLKMNNQTQFIPDGLELDKYMRYNQVRNKRIYYHDNDNYIGNEIRQGKYWESWMFEYIQKYYVPGKNMIDIGANIGTTSLMMEEVLSEGCKIYAFEPVYNNITFTNIVQNGKQDRITLYPIGLGDEDCEMDVNIFPPDEKENYGGMCLLRHCISKTPLSEACTNNCIKEVSNNHTKKISIRKLDHFNFENVCLIKMDVEDMEMFVLSGGIKTIIKNKPVIFLEIRQNMYDIITKSDIFLKLVDIGYTMDWLPYGCDDYVLFIRE